MNRIHSGFTLIELLIVVAIIAILAAIAVPNFLEAQTRAKVSRAKADMRTTATSVETYHIDNNTYVYQNPQGRVLKVGNGPLVLERITTPISYLSGEGAWNDPFKGTGIWNGPAQDQLNKPNLNDPDERKIFQYYRYFARNDTNPAILQQANAVFGKKPAWYIIGSAGTDLNYDNLNEPLTTRPNDTPVERAFFYDHCIYDASNGTVSIGSIYRVGGTPNGAGKAFYYAASSAQ